MDHKTLITALPPEEMDRLGARSDAKGLRHLAGHLAVIVGFTVWIVQGWPLWQVALLGQGIALCFLFTLEHEATHKTPFASAQINEWAGRIAGLVILNPFEWFRYFHLAHHRHTNIPDKDPELLSGAKPETPSAYIRHVSGLPYWAGMARQIITNAIGADPGAYVPHRARPRVRHEARVMLLVYAVCGISLLLSPLLFWVWILPCLLGQPFLRLYLLAEHGRCAFVSNMLENTRTTFTNRTVRFLAWNMPYHVEHHSLPQAPFHQLPVLHRHMKGHHRVTADGYASFTADYTRNLITRQ